MLLTSVVLGRAISDFMFDVRSTVVEPAFEPILPKGGILKVGKVNIKAGQLLASTVQFGTMVLLSYGAYELAKRLIRQEVAEAKQAGRNLLDPKEESNNKKAN